VEKNLAEAAKWYGLAAEQGNELAKEYLKEVQRIIKEQEEKVAKRQKDLEDIESGMKTAGGKKIHSACKIWLKKSGMEGITAELEKQMKKTRDDNCRCMGGLLGSMNLTKSVVSQLVASMRFGKELNNEQLKAVVVVATLNCIDFPKN